MAHGLSISSQRKSSVSLSYDLLEHSTDKISALHTRSVNMVKLVAYPSLYCRILTIKLSGICKILLTNFSMSLLDLCLRDNSQPSITCLNPWLNELSTLSWLKISEKAARRHQLRQQIAYSYTSGSKSPLAIFYLGEIIDHNNSPDTDRHPLYLICFASPWPEKPSACQHLTRRSQAWPVSSQLWASQ